MTVLAIVLLGLAWLVAAIGTIMILIKAFKAGIGWGLASLFIPFVILVFAIKEWGECKQGVMLWVASLGLTLVGGGCS